MREQIWKHRFVQALITMIRQKTGLGEDASFSLAFDVVNAFWRDFSVYESPEAAAEAALAQLGR